MDGEIGPHDVEDRVLPPAVPPGRKGHQQAPGDRNRRGKLGMMWKKEITARERRSSILVISSITSEKGARTFEQLLADIFDQAVAFRALGQAIFQEAAVGLVPQRRGEGPGWPCRDSTRPSSWGSRISLSYAVHGRDSGSVVASSSQR